MAAPDNPASMDETIEILPGVAPLAERYDGFVLDLWGVIHDGVRPYPGAVDSLRRLKARGKRLILLSNAPRRAAAVIEAMTAMGIPRDHYDDVLSSGEAAWHALRDRTDRWHARLGRRCFHLGPPRDKGMLVGLDIEPALRPGAADFILATGVDRDEETLADYEAVLAEGAAARVPLVCANPDLEVIRGGRRMICAGLLAARYEELGGPVAYHGKPHAPVYRACQAMMGGLPAERVAAVGDSLRTDIAGGRAAGLDTVLVTGGIHADEWQLKPGQPPDPALLLAACRRQGSVPTAAIPAFIW